MTKDKDHPACNSSALLSTDRRYRYFLLRDWDYSLPKVCFIGLNPSTADEREDDPTIRRCMNFARAWGRGGLLMLNLYAFRATIPALMWKADKNGTDIVGGPYNFTMALLAYYGQYDCDIAIAAWGKGKQDSRGRGLAASWPDLKCLAINADGSPKHPLYIKADQQPIPLGGK